MSSNSKKGKKSNSQFNPTSFKNSIKGFNHNNVYKDDTDTFNGTQNNTTY